MVTAIPYEPTSRKSTTIHIINQRDLSFHLVTVRQSTIDNHFANEPQRSGPKPHRSSTPTLCLTTCKGHVIICYRQWPMSRLACFLVHGDRVLHTLTVELGRMGYFENWDCVKQNSCFLHVFLKIYLANLAW